MKHNFVTTKIVELHDSQVRLRDSFDENQTKLFASRVLNISYGAGAISDSLIEYVTRLPDAINGITQDLKNEKVDLECEIPIFLDGNAEPTFIPAYFLLFAKAPQQVLDELYKNQRINFAQTFSAYGNSEGLTQFLCAQPESHMSTSFLRNKKAIELAYSLPQTTAIGLVERDGQIVIYGFVPEYLPHEVTSQFFEERQRALAAPSQKEIVSLLKSVAHTVAVRQSINTSSFEAALSSTLEEQAQQLFERERTGTIGRRIEQDFTKASEIDVHFAQMAQAQRLWQSATRDLFTRGNGLIFRQKEAVLGTGLQKIARTYLPRIGATPRYQEAAKLIR